MSKKNKKDEVELTSSEKMEGKLNSFLSRNRMLLIIICAVIVAALIVFIIVDNVSASNTEKQFDKIDQLETTYSELNAADATSEGYQAKVDDLKAQLQDFAKGKKYPSLKAQYLLATMAFNEKDYQTALDGYDAVYQNAKGSYLGSLALTNAAVAAEEKGDDAKALEYYTKVWDEFGVSAAEAPKALFNQARLQQKSDATLAKATYQQLIDQFPQSEYAKLAKSVIISL